MKIGVIGIGAVGYPLYKALQYYHREVYCFDKIKTSDDWSQMITTDIVFICVPSNPKSDGRLDMSIIESVLDDLKKSKYKGIAVIKSTLGLGFINDAIEKYPFKIIVFPEWLYESTAFADTLKPEMTVFGIDGPDVEKYKKLLLEACPWHIHRDSIVFTVPPEEAVMIKLTANALGSTKISFANQIQIICEEYGIDEDVVMDVIKQDPRCSPRYLTPGRPFEGHCLPKDFDELRTAIDGNLMFEGIKKINDEFLRRKKNDNI